MCDRKSIKSRYTMSQGNQRSLNPMKRGKNLELIPTDLIMEIFSRLPIKSIARFRSVSKLWGSMLGSPYFTELLMTRSSARPRLLFSIKGDGEWLFYSSPQPQNPYEKSSLVVAADYHTKFRGPKYRDCSSSYNCSYASGLINLFVTLISKYVLPVICNPSTGQYAVLPELRTDKYSTRFLGFDPIDKQFKVLMMTDTVSSKTVHHILTLGTDKVRWRWRKIQCPFIGHKPLNFSICINGVLYYLAHDFEGVHRWPCVIVCFDVRSEKFK